jgi:hypothetical protein
MVIGFHSHGWFSCVTFALCRLIATVMFGRTGILETRISYNQEAEPRSLMSSRIVHEDTVALQKNNYVY